MKKLSLCLFTFSAIVFGNATFAQDSVKHVTKASKITTHKTTTHHKVVKKTKPAM